MAGKIMMKEVYILQHIYEMDNCDEECKMLGVFSEYQLAQKAVEEYKKLPGFEKYPNQFVIDKYELNKLHWVEGFVSL